MRSSGPVAPAPTARACSRRVRRPSTPSSISSRTQSRARLGTRSPSIVKTGPDSAKNGSDIVTASVVEIRGRGAAPDPGQPAAGLVPELLGCAAGARGAGARAVRGSRGGCAGWGGAPAGVVWSSGYLEQRKLSEFLFLLK